MHFRERLVALREAGHSWAEVIQMLVRSGCKSHPTTLKRIWKRYKEQGHTQPGKSTGRPQVCSRRGVRRVVRAAMSDRRQSYMVAAKLKESNIDLSRITVARILKKEGYSRHGACSACSKWTPKTGPSRLGPSTPEVAILSLATHCFFGRENFQIIE